MFPIQANCPKHIISYHSCSELRSNISPANVIYFKTSRESEERQTEKNKCNIKASQ